MTSPKRTSAAFDLVSYVDRVKGNFGTKCRYYRRCKYISLYIGPGQTARRLVLCWPLCSSGVVQSILCVVSNQVRYTWYALLCCIVCPPSPMFHIRGIILCFNRPFALALLVVFAPLCLDHLCRGLFVSSLSWSIGWTQDSIPKQTVPFLPPYFTPAQVGFDANRPRTQSGSRDDVIVSYIKYLLNSFEADTDTCMHKYQHAT